MIVTCVGKGEDKSGNGRQTNMSSFCIIIIVKMYMNPQTGEWDVVYTVG